VRNGISDEAMSLERGRPAVASRSKHSSYSNEANTGNPIYVLFNLFALKGDLFYLFFLHASLFFDIRKSKQHDSSKSKRNEMLK